MHTRNVDFVFRWMKFLPPGDVERRCPNGEIQYLDVTVIPLYDEANSPFGVAIYFPTSPLTTGCRTSLQGSREEI